MDTAAFFIVLIIACVVLYALTRAASSDAPAGEASHAAGGGGSRSGDTVAYNLALNIHRCPSEAEPRKFDTSALCGLLREDVIERIRANVERIREKHGADEMFVVEVGTGVIYNEGYLDTHDEPTLADEVILDVGNQMEFTEHKLVPCLNVEDRALISDIFIWRKDPAYGRLDDVKITGVYLDDMSIWAGSNKFPNRFYKLIVFYKSDRGGDDDDDDRPDNPVSSETIEEMLLMMRLTGANRIKRIAKSKTSATK